MLAGFSNKSCCDKKQRAEVFLISPESRSGIKSSILSQRPKQIQKIIRNFLSSQIIFIFILFIFHSNEYWIKAQLISSAALATNYNDFLLHQREDNSVNLSDKRRPVNPEEEIPSTGEHIGERFIVKPRPAQCTDHNHITWTPFQKRTILFPYNFAIGTYN